jgi:hypothetical protein
MKRTTLTCIRLGWVMCTSQQLFCWGRKNKKKNLGLRLGDMLLKCAQKWGRDRSAF